MTASLTLSAFGQTLASSGSSTSAYQFGATSGYRSEGDAGLTLVGCRYYDAQVGRFITRDTYLDQAPYAYCDGDPVNAVDPTGHDGTGLGSIHIDLPVIVWPPVLGQRPGSPPAAPPPPATPAPPKSNPPTPRPPIIITITKSNPGPGKPTTTTITGSFPIDGRGDTLGGTISNGTDGSSTKSVTLTLK